MVVVVDVDAEDVLKVAAVENQQPIQALRADSADEPSAIAFAFGARTGVFTIRIPSLRKTSSKGRCTCCPGRGSRSGRRSR